MFIETSEASGMPEHPAIAALSTPMQMPRPILNPSNIATPRSEPCHGVSSEDEIGDISNSIDLALIRKISDYQPDIIGFSMSFDVSYKYLNRLSDLVFKNFGESMVQVVGGPAASTAYAEILDRSRNIDAVCFSEGS
jgi:hypothetical protein